MPTRAVLLDAHAHYYVEYDALNFLKAAAQNFKEAAARRGLAADTPGVLILASTERSRFPFRTAACRASLEAAGWAIRDTVEPETFLAERKDACPLVLVDGQQIRTAEGIELIVVGQEGRLTDGQDFEESVRRASEEALITMIPWGFGKWWFRRGKLVAWALRSFNPRTVFLSDSAQRPRLSPPSSILIEAARAGRPILAGTDPLPLRGEWQRVGSYGTICRGTFDARNPLLSIRTALSAEILPTPFGRRVDIPSFIRSQVKLRVTAALTSTGG